MKKPVNKLSSTLRNPEGHYTPLNRKARSLAEVLSLELKDAKDLVCFLKNLYVYMDNSEIDSWSESKTSILKKLGIRKTYSIDDIKTACQYFYIINTDNMKNIEAIKFLVQAIDNCINSKSKALLETISAEFIEKWKAHK